MISNNRHSNGPLNNGVRLLGVRRINLGMLLAQMLNIDGVLIYETFMIGNEHFGKPSNPDYLLLQDELHAVYAPLLKIHAFEQGEVKGTAPSVMQRICAVKTHL